MPRSPPRPPPNTFAAPDVLRRRLLHTGEPGDLTNAELRVYLFIAGQTMGWGKESDAISHEQIRSGITRKNGEVWSTGTGLDTRTIRRAIDRLIALGLIGCSRTCDDRHGHGANTYSLRLGGDIPEGP